MSNPRTITKLEIKDIEETPIITFLSPSTAYVAGSICVRGNVNNCVKDFQKYIFFAIINPMKEQTKKLTNFSFGSTSAIITNISLIVGLGSTDISKSAILGGLLVLGIADNISDSLGHHIYKESEGSDAKESFISAILNFTVRLFISLSFILIILLFPIQEAQLISSIFGLFLLIVISYLIAIRNKQNPALEVLKHIGIAILVIIASKYVGTLIHRRLEGMVKY